MTDEMKLADELEKSWPLHYLSDKKRGMILAALRSTAPQALAATPAEEGRAKAALAYLIDHIVYSDSYGVDQSDFQACHLCQGGGAPRIPMIHDSDCPVLRCEAIAEEWWQERHEGEIEELCDIIKAKDAQLFVAEQELKHLAATPAVPVRLEAWIRENFAGHGRALRRETDAPLEGEPWMSMDDAKELTRQAVALFGRAATPARKEAAAAQHFDLPKGEPARFVRNGVLETCECRDCAALAATPAVGERNDLLDLAAQIERAQVLYLNQFGTPNVAPLRDAFAQLLWDNKGTFAAALRAAAQPASPLRGRDSLLHALQDIAAKRWDENADLDDICTMAESAIKLHSASPPEQSAAAPVTPTNLRQALIDEAKPLRYGEPVWPNNDEANDLDKGDDA